MAAAAALAVRMAYFSPSSWALLLSCISLAAVSSTLQPQSIASRQKVKSARLMVIGAQRGPTPRAGIGE
jgi:hypothetical protein